jgi:mRNA interferase RelE/StbE
VAEYQLTISRQASKEFEALPAEVIERVRLKIRALATTPRPTGSKKLRDTKRTWRIRIGDWRVLYEIDDARKVVDVAAIRHRSQAY